jgi:NitT/TauT family transport system substrate-binding protein
MKHPLLPSRRAFVAGASATTISAVLPRRRAMAQSSGLIRVLTVGADAGALAYYAQETGNFARAGLNVDVATMGNGSATLTAVAGGAVEIGEANVGSIAAGVLNGLPFTIVADCSLYESRKPIAILCVAPNSPVKGPKDLAGKTIAVNGLRNIAQAAVQAWLEKNGVDSKGVGWVELTFSAMAPAVESGRIDAALIAEPALTAARGNIRVLAAPYDVVAPQFSLGTYMANRDWVAKNHDTAARFSAVLRETAAWANANPEPAGRMLAKFMKLPETVIAAMTRVQYPTSVQASNLQPSIDVMAKYGYISKRVDARTLIARL